MKMTLIYDRYIYQEWTLTKDIGLTDYFIEEDSAASTHLIAAIIDGVQYGEFVTIKEQRTLPLKFNLYQPFPNPFNPITTIDFTLPISGPITLRVYDLMGREVETLVNQILNSGIHSTVWNGSNSPSGIYFIKMVSGRVTQTQKAILLK